MRWARLGFMLMESTSLSISFASSAIIQHCQGSFWNKMGKHKPDALLIEDHGSGSALIQDLRQRHGIGAIPITPTSDKIVRLSIVSPMFERGEIFLPQNADWLIDFLDELLRFPQARFDDQVDSVTQYLNWHRTRQTPI